MASLSLASINIEHTVHLGTVLPFVREQQPDVLCLQEIFKKDLSEFEAFGYKTHFLPMSYRDFGEGFFESGVAFCTKIPDVSVSTFYYAHGDMELTKLDTKNNNGTQRRGALVGRLKHDGESFVIATTHFTWTPDGHVSEQQKIDMDIMLHSLETIEPHILCGDFNIPRSLRELYLELIKHYTDAIPESYGSSLDKNLHKAGGIEDRAFIFEEYMVDYLFTQPGYRAENVQLHFGVSDHAAITATIIKT